MSACLWGPSLSMHPCTPMHITHTDRASTSHQQPLLVPALRRETPAVVPKTSRNPSFPKAPSPSLYLCSSLRFPLCPKSSCTLTHLCERHIPANSPLALPGGPPASQQCCCSRAPKNSQGIPYNPKAQHRENAFPGNPSPQLRSSLLQGFSHSYKCSLPPRRVLVMLAHCGCCPGRVPRRSLQGGSVGLAPDAPHPAPPAPVHLQGEGWSQSVPSPSIPVPIRARKKKKVLCRYWENPTTLGSPNTGTAVPRPGKPTGAQLGGPIAVLGVWAHRGAAGRKERFPSPHPKSQRLQGLMALII